MENAVHPSVAAQKSELIALCKTLCAIPAPSHQEDLRVEFITKWLEDAGAKGVTVDAAKNVLLPFNCDGKDRITVFMAHTDTVFPDTQPLPVVEKDGRICSPGIGDDTSNAAILMLLARMLIQANATPKDGVLIVLNSCEEGLGNLKGCRQFMADYTGRIKEVISFDGYWDEVCTMAVGSARYQVEVRTEGGHSYAAFGNRNAIQVLASMITTLYTMKVPNEGSKTTYNVGGITGGTSVNTIAQQAEMLYEYRSDRRSCMDQMKVFFESVIETYRAMGVEVHVTLLGERPCMGDVDPQAEKALAGKAIQLIYDVVGIESGEKSSSTDCNIPFSLGIPAISFGLLNGGGPHTREEWVEIDSLCPGMEIGRRLIFPYFGL